MTWNLSAIHGEDVARNIIFTACILKIVSLKSTSNVLAQELLLYQWQDFSIFVHLKIFEENFLRVFNLLNKASNIALMQIFSRIYKKFIQSPNLFVLAFWSKLGNQMPYAIRWCSNYFLEGSEGNLTVSVGFSTVGRGGKPSGNFEFTFKTAFEMSLLMWVLKACKTISPQFSNQFWFVNHSFQLFSKSKIGSF